MTRRILLSLLIALPAAAKERDGVVAPPAITVEGRTLHLMGMGLRKKLWLASIWRARRRMRRR
jgi:hypothetical protein